MRDITSIAELNDIAGEVLSSRVESEGAFVVALHGELGAGKTAFVKELGHVLGVAHEITSPTFVVMRSYPFTEGGEEKTLTHIDAYRIESDDEMRVLGLAEILNDRNRIVCIEWPEKIQNLIPENAYRVSLSITNGENRQVTYGT